MVFSDYSVVIINIMFKWIFCVRLKRKHLRGPALAAFYYNSGQSMCFPALCPTLVKEHFKRWFVIMWPGRKAWEPVGRRPVSRLKCSRWDWSRALGRKASREKEAHAVYR